MVQTRTMAGRSTKANERSGDEGQNVDHKLAYLYVPKRLSKEAACSLVNNADDDWHVDYPYASMRQGLNLTKTLSLSEFLNEHKQVTLIFNESEEPKKVTHCNRDNSGIFGVNSCILKDRKPQPAHSNRWFLERAVTLVHANGLQSSSWHTSRVKHLLDSREIPFNTFVETFPNTRLLLDNKAVLLPNGTTDRTMQEDDMPEDIDDTTEVPWKLYNNIISEKYKNRVEKNCATFALHSVRKLRTLAAEAKIAPLDMINTWDKQKLCETLGHRKEVADIPEVFRDTVSLELLLDPEVLPCGHSFSSQTIKDIGSMADEKMLKPVCPLCRTEIPKSKLPKNYTLSGAIEFLLKDILGYD